MIINKYVECLIMNLNKFVKINLLICFLKHMMLKSQDLKNGFKVKLLME